jgi:hypothetical protein
VLPSRNHRHTGFYFWSCYIYKYDILYPITTSILCDIIYSMLFFLNFPKFYCFVYITLINIRNKHGW